MPGSSPRSPRRPRTPRADGAGDEALVEILRGRLEGLGPVTAAALAAPLGLEPGGIAAGTRSARGRGLRACAAASRLALRPTNGASAGCSPGFTATRSSACAPRSSRSPRATSCASCSAGSASIAETRMQGPDALEVVVAQLEGFEAPAGAWETEILPARLAEYEPSWLDDQCLAGRITWARLSAAQRPLERRRARPSPVRSTPITLLARRHAPLWAVAVAGAGRGPAKPPGRRRSPTAFGRGARRSSTSWSRAAACCAPRSRRRSPSWWRSGS